MRHLTRQFKTVTRPKVSSDQNVIKRKLHGSLPLKMAVLNLIDKLVSGMF